MEAQCTSPDGYLSDASLSSGDMTPEWYDASLSSDAEPSSDAELGSDYLTPERPVARARPIRAVLR